MLARERPQELADLGALGTALREAQAELDGDALRRLSSQRHQVVHRLSSDAQRLATERGQQVSGDALRELEGTLEAGFYDPDAAEQLRRGRLTVALYYSGIGFGSATPAPRSSRSSRQPATRSASSVSSVISAPSPTSTSSSQSASSRRSGRRSGPPSIDPSDRRQRAEEVPTGRAKKDALGIGLRQARNEATRARRAAEQAAADLLEAERTSAREQAALSAAEDELVRRREAVRAARGTVARARSERNATEVEARRAEQRVEQAQRSARRQTPR